MRIAIAASGKWLDSDVDSHTGRAPFFIVYDEDDEDYKVIDNSSRYRCQHWAGSHTAKMLVEASVDVVLVRRIGPCAHRWFKNAEVPIFCTPNTSIAKAVRRFREGSLPPIDEPNCQGHFHDAEDK